MSRFDRLEELDRSLALGSLVRACPHPRHDAGPLEELGLRERVFCARSKALCASAFAPSDAARSPARTSISNAFVLRSAASGSSGAAWYASR
jgi:hypothetical protein